jgi:hypothetical protein
MIDANEVVKDSLYSGIGSDCEEGDNEVFADRKMIVKKSNTYSMSYFLQIICLLLSILAN